MQPQACFPQLQPFCSPQQEELATSAVPSSSSVRPSGCKLNLPTFAWPADSSETGVVIAQSSVTQPLLGDCNPNKNQDEYLNRFLSMNLIFVPQKIIFLLLIWMCPLKHV